jgi:cellobiose PTS system EIIA component
MNETVIFEIILHAGNAKAEAFAALEAAQAGDFVKAAQHLRLAEEEATTAHKAQTGIIQREAGGEKSEISVLFVHAQDLLMTAITERELIKNMVGMHKTIQELSRKMEGSR